MRTLNLLLTFYIAPWAKIHHAEVDHFKTTVTLETAVCTFKVSNFSIQKLFINALKSGDP